MYLLFLFSPFVVVVFFWPQCLILVCPTPSHSRTVPGEFISFVREKEKANQKEEATLKHVRPTDILLHWTQKE